MGYGFGKGAILDSLGAVTKGQRQPEATACSAWRTTWQLYMLLYTGKVEGGLLQRLVADPCSR